MSLLCHTGPLNKVNDTAKVCALLCREYHSHAHMAFLSLFEYGWLS